MKIFIFPDINLAFDMGFTRGVTIKPYRWDWVFNRLSKSQNIRKMERKNRPTENSKAGYELMEKIGRPSCVVKSIGLGLKERSRSH